MSTRSLAATDVFLVRMDSRALPNARHQAGTSSGRDGAVANGLPYSDKAAVSSLLARLLVKAGLDIDHVETTAWNPLGELIRPGDAVALKPNWVNHKNRPGYGMDCLVTHVSVVSAVLDFVLQAKPGKVVIGDAPIQGCDLPTLLTATGYDALREHHAQVGTVSWRDYRRTILTNPDGVWDRRTNVRPLEDYVLFDLGSESLLEPIAHDADRFRVSMYNPDLMHQTHAPGRHQYLIAREMIEADVVINLPKLKTHRKAGVTGALKNVVGINGNKDYLPHHRFGGSRTGGDCYAGGNLFKLAAEYLTDASNRREGMAAFVLRQTVLGSYILARLTGRGKNLDGSWHGNDTVWRMALDLNRILLYGRLDGTMADLPQRRVLTVTDAIVCGEGEGPLAPMPHAMGILTLAVNSVAAEYVHAHLMGFDWRKIHLIREAFGQFEYPLCKFKPEDIEANFEGQHHRQPWPSWHARPFVPPEGWKGHCELQDTWPVVTAPQS